MRRPPFCAHFPCSCGRRSWRLRRCFICYPAGANCESGHRFSRPAEIRLDIIPTLLVQGPCCGGFAVVVESASHWGGHTGPALGGVPAFPFQPIAPPNRTGAGSAHGQATARGPGLPDVCSAGSELPREAPLKGRAGTARQGLLCVITAVATARVDTDQPLHGPLIAMSRRSLLGSMECDWRVIWPT